MIQVGRKFSREAGPQTTPHSGCRGLTDRGPAELVLAEDGVRN